MARTKADMQRLIDQRDQLLREIEAIRNKIAGIEMAIALLDGDTSQASGRSQKSVKAVLLDLLKEVGTTGLSAANAVDMASRRGITLHSGSVSSTLSRLKSLDAVVLDGNKYILRDYVNRHSSQIVVPWPTVVVERSSQQA